MRDVLHICLLFVLCSVAEPAALAQEIDIFTCQVKEKKQTFTIRFGVTDIVEPNLGKLVDLSGGAGTLIQVFPKTLKDGSASALDVLNFKPVFVMDHSKHLMLLASENEKIGRIGVYLGGVTRYKHGMLVSTVKGVEPQELVCTRDEL